MLPHFRLTRSADICPARPYPYLIPHSTKGLAHSRCTKQCAVLSRSSNSLHLVDFRTLRRSKVRVVSASPVDGALTATSWVVVLAATAVTFSYMLKAFQEAKIAIERREERQEAKEKEDERREAERQEKLKKMFERL